MGGQAEALTAEARKNFRAGPGPGRRDPRRGQRPGRRRRRPTASRARLPATQLEVAVLDRTRGKRKFRRITGAALTPAAAARPGRARGSRLPPTRRATMPMMADGPTSRQNGRHARHRRRQYGWLSGPTEPSAPRDPYQADVSHRCVAHWSRRLMRQPRRVTNNRQAGDRAGWMLITAVRPDGGVVASSEADLLRTLHDQHAGALWAYAVNLTNGDRAKAQDVVQETMLRAWRNPQVLDQSGGSARGWLFTVARRIVIDDWRAARSRPELVYRRLPEPAVARHAPTRRVDRQLVLRRAATLSDRAPRGAASSATSAGRRWPQAAAALGIPPGTVKSRTHYALRALRAALEDMGGVHDDPRSVRDDDAAYVLGALCAAPNAPLSRRTCAPVPGLHARGWPNCAACPRCSPASPKRTLPSDGAPVAEPVPDTLLPGAAARGADRAAPPAWARRRPGIGLAAACALALTLVLAWPSGTPTRRPVAMTALRPSPVQATAQLDSVELGDGDHPRLPLHRQLRRSTPSTRWSSCDKDGTHPGRRQLGAVAGRGNDVPQRHGLAARPDREGRDHLGLAPTPSAEL